MKVKLKILDYFILRRIQMPSVRHKGQGHVYNLILILVLKNPSSVHEIGNKKVTQLMFHESKLERMMTKY